MKRAIDKGLVEVHFHNLRIIPRTNKSVDDYQYGGAGMVMTVQPIDACITQ
jgi:tRNA (guanine37-N1)-methyltransferase